MRNFVIVADSTVDLDREIRERFDIKYIPMHFSYDDNNFDASLDWEGISADRFYEMMSENIRFLTSQIIVPEFEAAFESYINQGLDVLYIACSSALSASVKASYVARDNLAAKYPEAKIICVDPLVTGGGQAILCIKASKMRAEGKTIDECAAWIEENKLSANQLATVDKLSYLKRAGRVSAASAFFGGILNIKPIIVSDVKGRNAGVEKVKGRKAALARMAEYLAEKYIPSEFPIFIHHASCPEDVEILKSEVLARLPAGDTPEIHVGYIGPIIGSTTGPGSICLSFFGTPVTYDADNKQ